MFGRMGAIRESGEADSGSNVQSIRLAVSAPFAVGALQVEPALRRAVWPGGERILEPRVMQGLVALAEAKGGIVSRDTLIARCWDGRIVGENAINRVISLLRDLAEESGCFEIETITKVGYRLLATSGVGTVPAAVEPAAPVTMHSSRRGLILGVAAAAIAAAGGLAWWQTRPYSPSPEAQELFRHAVDTYRTARVPDEQVLAELQEAVRIAPEYAEAWGMLALVYGDLEDETYSGAGWKPADRMRDAANRALALDPNEMRAHIALLTQSSVYGNWGRFETTLKDLSRIQEHALVMGMLGALLQEVGRFQESLTCYEKANRDLLINPVGHMKYVVGLWASGQEEAADTALASVSRRFPRHPSIWPTAVRLKLFGPHPADALPLLDSKRSEAAGRDPLEIEAIRLTAEALSGGAESKHAAAVSASQVLARSGKSPWMALCCLASLAALDDSFQLLEGMFFGKEPYSALKPTHPSAFATNLLFFPPMRSLWIDPRFDTLTARIGLESYWQQSGSQPDYRRLIGIS